MINKWTRNSIVLGSKPFRNFIPDIRLRSTKQLKQDDLWQECNHEEDNKC